MSRLDEFISDCQSVDVADEPNYSDQELKQKFKLIIQELAENHLQDGESINYASFIREVENL